MCSTFLNALMMSILGSCLLALGGSIANVQQIGSSLNFVTRVRKWQCIYFASFVGYCWQINSKNA